MFATAVLLSAALTLAQPDPTPKDIAAARDKAVKFLRDRQQPDGSWEDAGFVLTDMHGGVTGLVALSLLEAGVTPDDPAVANAASWLAKLPRTKTYVVSLQTQVLARAGAKKYATEIQAGAGWLSGSVVRVGGELRG